MLCNARFLLAAVIVFAGCGQDTDLITASKSATTSTSESIAPNGAFSLPPDVTSRSTDEAAFVVLLFESPDPENIWTYGREHFDAHMGEEFRKLWEWYITLTPEQRQYVLAYLKQQMSQDWYMRHGFLKIYSSEGTSSISGLR